MNRRNTTARLAAWLAVGALLSQAPAWAKELDEGTVINKDNVESLLNDTFEGHPISELVPDSMRLWMREAALEVRLAHSQPTPLPPKLAEATAQNRGKAQYHPDTKTVSDYVAGIPFPDVDVKDPHAGMKMLWNWELSGLVYQDIMEITAPTLVISMDKGLERSLYAEGITVKMQGRTSIPPVTVDPAVNKRQVLVFTKPYDIAGIGTMLVRYVDPNKPDDAWVYVKSVRRLRRLTGGSWMDPIANLDQLYDDYFALDSNPGWYRGAKVLGKQYLLGVAHGLKPETPHKSEERIHITGQPPFCSPLGQPWEPREVYKLEIELPDTHPYSRKVLYMDAQIPLFYLAEAWDRKGEFWKVIYMMYSRQGEQLDGQTGGVQISGNGGIDFQRRHCNYVDTDFYRNNNPNIRPQDVDENLLRKGGTGGSILAK